MSRVTPMQKLSRGLHFLVAMKDDGLRIPLIRAGFTDRDHEEGWRLLRATGLATLGEDTGKAHDELVAARAELDALAERHLVLVEPAIKRRYPAAHALLYGGMMGLTGKEAMVGVQVFIDRLQTGTKKDGIADARKLLEERGLTDEVLAHLAQVLQRVRAGVPLSSDAPPPHDHAKAVDELWAWFSEWGAVARKTVSDRRILQRLGLVGDGKNGDDDVEAGG